MERTLRYIFVSIGILFLSFVFFVYITGATNGIQDEKDYAKSNSNIVIDTPPPHLIYPLPVNTGIPDTSEHYPSPLFLNNPSNNIR